MPLDLTRLRNDFHAAAQNGVISGPEAEDLIRRFRRNRLTESEANLFVREAAHYQQLFNPEGARKIREFIKDRMKKVEVLDPGKKPDPMGLKDPAVLKADRKRLEQEVVRDAQLFKNGIRGSDPEQNYIGDCYLMAAMSAVAQLDPQAIRKAFRRNRDGSYTVTLYDKKGGKFFPHPVRIDADLPRDGWYGYYYARSMDPHELWPALLEKAFAARAGSYGKIEAGVPGEAMEAITGRRSKDLDMRAAGVGKEQVWATLQAAMKARKPTTAATLSDSSAAKYKKKKLYSDHTYAVFGVSTEKGVRYVHLRNPWGESEPAGNGRDDGIFKIPLDEFMSLFSGISVNG